MVAYINKWNKIINGKAKYLNLKKMIFFDLRQKKWIKTKKFLLISLLLLWRTLGQGSGNNIQTSLKINLKSNISNNSRTFPLNKKIFLILFKKIFLHKLI